MSNLTDLELSNIRMDGGTQPRAGLNQEVIEEYAQHMMAGVQFPPVVVFYDGTSYWLVDGFHRVEAARKAGATRIAADLYPGTLREAILHSVGVNATHGLRRSNEDKRKAVQILLHDPEWSQWSDGAIARQCGVTQRFVSKLRHQSASTQNSSESSIRRSINGRIVDTTNIGKRTKSFNSLSQPSAPDSSTQPESSDSLSPKPLEEEGLNLMESSLAAAKPYKPGDRIRILRRQDGEDKWSGAIARIREITLDGRLRVDVEGSKGVRFTLNPEWVEPMSETPESYKVQPEQAPQQPNEPDSESPETANDPSGKKTGAVPRFQAGDQLYINDPNQQEQQWVGEVAEVIEVAEDRVQVLIEIPRLIG